MLDTVLKRKPIFDPFLQISVLVPDTLRGFAMLAAAMSACSCHGWRYSGDSSVQGGNCQTAAALMIFGKTCLPLDQSWLFCSYVLPALNLNTEVFHLHALSLKKSFLGLAEGTAHELAGPCNSCVGTCLWPHPAALLLGKTNLT